MVSVQSIIPGTELYFRLDMSDTLTPAQTGLMLTSLVALLNEQALGGWVRTGFGRFKAEHFALTLDGEQVAVIQRGAKGDYELAEALAPYVEAMRSELAALTVPDLLEFFTARKEAKLTKKAKGGANVEAA
jgi:CRISPR type IV-associated protein Csf2